jgi:allophanate hydrolase subunit 1
MGAVEGAVDEIDPGNIDLLVAYDVDLVAQTIDESLHGVSDKGDHVAAGAAGHVELPVVLGAGLGVGAAGRDRLPKKPIYAYTIAEQRAPAPPRCRVWAPNLVEAGAQDQGVVLQSPQAS